MKKLNTYLNDKNNLIIFLIILIGVLVPLFSGHLEYNFWINLLNILTSPTSILFPYYFQVVEYQNILLEILCFIIQVFILIILNKITFNHIIKKKRDLL